MGDILFLAHRIPYPPDKGDKIRSWNILRYLAQRENVHLGAFVDDPDDLQHLGMLTGLCASVKLLPIRRRDRWLRSFAGWRRDMPLSVSIYDDREMHRWVRQTLRGADIDRLFVFSSQMAPYALAHTAEHRHVVMDFVDMDSEKFRQYAREDKGLKARLYVREARLLAAFEKQVARHVDLSLFVSEAEAATFRAIAGSYGHSVDTLHNGVDLDYFRPDAEVEAVELAGAPSLVFTGAMDYRPNIDAVRWFATEILPRVRVRFPDAGLTVVGSRPTAEVMALDGKQGVVVTGRVPDVRPYLAAADVSVAPIRIARGVQNKVLEAMAMAKPVVASEAAFEGLQAEAGIDLVVTDSASRFAAAVQALSEDSDAARKLGERARARVVANYAWETQLIKLDRYLSLPGMNEAAA